MSIVEYSTKVIKIAKYKPAPYNPRPDLQPGDVEYQKLDKSMEELGLLQLLVVNDETGHIISGHQRAKILQAHGVEETEAIVVSFSLQKEKIANLALNRIGEGNWDREKLGVLLEELSKMPDFEIGLTGFEVPEISRILDGLHESKDPDDFDFDAVAESIKEPITKHGEILVLGSHRVLCGDATDSENIRRLFENDKASLYWCDLPYGVSYDASNRPGANSSQWDSIQNDNLTDDEYVEWIKCLLKTTVNFLVAGAPAYIWTGHRQFWSMHHCLEEVGIHPATVITWAKPSFSPSYCDYQFATEFLLYGWKKGAPHFFYGSAESTLWEAKRDPAKSLIHPTQKPVELAQRAIRNSSQRGEIVFDSCLGSGSALIAAESLGRRCFGLEIEPKYVDALILRYISFVGKDKTPAELVRKYAKEY